MTSSYIYLTDTVTLAAELDARHTGKTLGVYRIMESAESNFAFLQVCNKCVRLVDWNPEISGNDNNPCLEQGG